MSDVWRVVGSEFWWYTLCICTLGCPKKNVFCESWHMMGEVIIKWFYFYYFRFRQLFERALLKNQNQHFFFQGAQSQGMPLKLLKKNFADFRKFYFTTFPVNLHHFSYFDQTKKSAKFFFIIFSGILTFHAPHCFRACAQRNIRNLGFEQRSLE